MLEWLSGNLGKATNSFGNLFIPLPLDQHESKISEQARVECKWNEPMHPLSPRRETLAHQLWPSELRHLSPQCDTGVGLSLFWPRCR